MRPPLRVGTRGSVLALRQTELVVRSLRRHHPGLRVEVVPITTRGDRDPRRGISPDFTGAIEKALSSGAIDVAVHSAKDLAAGDPPGLVIAAYPPRADPRDGWVSRQRGLLPKGAHVGTSSVRRRAQLLRWRPDLVPREIRGNVDSRIRKVASRQVDAIIVARAGVVRLGRSNELRGVLPLRWFLPSPGQGALAVQTRASDGRTRSLVRAIDHPPTRASVEAERSVARTLNASCNVPLGALARVHDSRLRICAEVLSSDGVRSLRASRAGPATRARALGRSVGEALKQAGAGRLLR